MSKVAKSFAFTLNNYTDDEILSIKNLDYNYLIFGYEKGKNGTPHLQGTITFKKAMRENAVRKAIPRAHIEVVISLPDSIKYCKKEGNYFEDDKGTQGKRNDLIILADEIKNKPLNDVILSYPHMYIKFHNGMEKLASKYIKPRNFKPIVIWLWGESGSGKSRSVVEFEKDLWISGKNLKWWQGYNNQEATLFDDFRGDFCTYHELLRILDRYPYEVEFKGGSTQLNSKRMYITSCHHPEDLYKSVTEDKIQLIRRIDMIIKTVKLPEYENWLSDVECLKISQ